MQVISHYVRRSMGFPRLIVRRVQVNALTGPREVHDKEAPIGNGELGEADVTEEVRGAMVIETGAEMQSLRASRPKLCYEGLDQPSADPSTLQAPQQVHVQLRREMLRKLRRCFKRAVDVLDCPPFLG